jgi:hypothetical protein
LKPRRDFPPRFHFAHGTLSPRFFAMPDSSSPVRPGHRGKLVAVLVGVLLFYAASPYYSVWRFGESIRAHDLDALRARVDFETVRGSLKKQLRDHFLGALNEKQKERLTEFFRTSVNDPLDQLIDAYITPEGLAALIANPGPVKNATSISTLPGLDRGAKQIDWSKFRNAFFTGPGDFAVDHEDIKLRFRFNGAGWKLHAIDLQLPAKK